MSGSSLFKAINQQLSSRHTLTEHRAASIIQKFWKRYKIRKTKRQQLALAKSKCDCPLCYFRNLCKKHRIFYLNRCATIIQAHWLGYITRKHQFRDRDVRLVYRSLMAANNSATEEAKLGRRMDAALIKLASNKVNCHIDGDLCTLEVATRMSPECCFKAAKNNVISMMVHILNDSNRSEAHKPRVNHSIGVLVNLAKYHKCSPFFRDGEAIGAVCLKMIKIHKKTDQILLKCATLLALIVRNSKVKEMITKDTMNRFTIESITKTVRIDGKYPDIIKIIKSNNLKFEPYWCLRKGVKYQFTDRSTALAYLHLLFG